MGCLLSRASNRDLRTPPAYSFLSLLWPLPTILWLLSHAKKRLSDTASAIYRANVLLIFRTLRRLVQISSVYSTCVMSSYSPYAEAESGPPEWKPGEEEATTAFLALTFWLILDLNVGIHRVFRKKQGLYYWMLMLGTWGCAFSTIGNVLKNLTPQYGPKIWPLWTLLINGGWSVYATAECLVLFSRLHLVNRSHKVQRRILILIIIGSFLLIVPNWVFMFPAYNLNPSVSSVWSPRQAIVDRTSQLGFTVIESTISGVYLWSLAKLLRVKSTVRQRIVMRDLLYVNIIIIAFDIVVSVLVFVNETNLSYSIQDFTYALKFKLEFMVLNQLMAVAARGLRKESFAERRYNYPKTVSDDSPDASSKGTSIPLQQFSERSQASRDHEAGIAAPPATYVNGRKSPRDKFERMHTDEQPLRLDQYPSSHSDVKRQGSPGSDIEANNPKKDAASYDIHLRPDAKSPTHRSRRHPLGHRHKDQNPGSEGMAATATMHKPKQDDDDEEEEIGVHMWENRGKLVLDVPWLKDGTKA